MKMIWSRILFVIVITLSISACSQPNEPVAEEPPIQNEQQVDDQDVLDESDLESEDAETESSQVDEVEEPESTEAEEEEIVPPAIDAAQLFASNCAGCHGNNRQGGSGPALLPDRLTKSASEYAEFIASGSGRMPAFESRLTSEEIQALAEWILTPVK